VTLDSRRILVVAPDPDARTRLADALTSAGYGVALCASIDDGAALEAGSIRLVVLDSSGAAAEDPRRHFEALKRRRIAAPCLVALPRASVDDAVDLIRKGACGVFSLPFSSEKLLFHVEHALAGADLSEKNANLEKSLATHERLAMIGKLAAGAAHELNNPLDGVLRYVNMSIEGLPKDAPQVPYLIEARRGLRRMADIVHDLLQCSRNAGIDSTYEDAERLARDAVAQSVATAPNRRITTRFSFPEVGAPTPRAMFQVLANLAKNAVDAMPQGGELSVRARIASGRLVVEVADTGTGIPEEIRDRIFEPFFTTKDVGRGTGLGLSICQRIVERLGGALTIESEVGRGTTVTIDVPAGRPAGTRATAPAAAFAVAPEGRF